MSVPDHLYWFAPYNLTCPSTRYRGKLPLEYLENHDGITHDFFYPEANLWAYCHLLWMLLKIRFWGPKNALIMVQKICTQRRYAAVLKWLVRRKWLPVWYDLDDAEQYRQPTDTLHYFLRHCDGITVGSDALALYARQFNNHVYLNTSPVPLQEGQQQVRNTPFTIGWVGDTGDGNAASIDFAHKKSLLELLLPALELLDFPFRLVLIGVKQPQDIALFESHAAKQNHWELVLPTDLDWRDDAWLYTYIRAFDVGVSPLVNHPFNEAKSAFKAKQYLACGVPVVGSAVGENGKFIIQGKNGFLGKTIEELAAGLRQLYYCSEEEYQAHCHEAKEGALQFTVARYVGRWVDWWSKKPFFETSEILEKET